MVKESFSIKTTAGFKAVFDAKCSASDGLLIVFALPNGRQTSRLGLSVSKRYGGAVERVRWKRLVREAFRQVVPQLEQTGMPPMDFVVVPGKARRSDYGPDILAVQKYGFVYGTLKGIWRILRCNPFCKGGEDFP